MARQAVLLATWLLIVADPGQVPDPGYKPAVGDRAELATVFPGHKPTFTVAAISIEDLATVHENSDPDLPGRGDVLARLVREHRIVMLPVGTVVKVLAFETTDFRYRDTLIYLAVARVAIRDGKYVGREFHVGRAHVVHHIPEPEAPPAPSTPRTVSLLMSGRNLEKAGKTKGAIDFYQQVARQYPGTSEAEAAVARLEALGSKVPTPEEYEAPPPEASVSSRFPRPVKPRYASQAANREASEQALGSMVNQVFVQEEIRRSTHECGARTLNGTRCRRLVVGPGYCYQHQGQ